MSGIENISLGTKIFLKTHYKGNKVNIKKTYIIAEIGNNHEGNFSLAKKMISLAKKTGVDAVKFQSYKTENFINPTLKKALKGLKNSN